MLSTRLLFLAVAWLAFLSTECRAGDAVVPLPINTMVAEGKAALSASPYDIGSPSNLFDGNTSTLYRSANVNPAFIQVAFTEPQTFHGFKTWLSHASGNPAFKWKVEAANAEGDFASGTGSFVTLVPWKNTAGDLWSESMLATPVERSIVRLTVQRLTGDNYVHINEWVILGQVDAGTLSVTPTSLDLQQGSLAQLSAIWTDLVGVQSDVTALAAWTSTNSNVASVNGSGQVIAVGEGSAQIVATYQSVTDQVDVLVEGLPPSPIDLNVRLIERLPRYDYDATKNAPSPGDPVEFRAHLRNWGSDAAGDVPYEWRIDGVVALTGVATNVGPYDARQLTLPWVWASGSHLIEFVVDPTDVVAEVSETNNAVAIRTDAIIVGFWVEESLYHYFNEHQKDLGIGSNSWDDWAQRQMARWNQYSAEAIWPNSPNGVLDRVRIDKIIVVPDGALPLSGGLPTNNPDLSDKSVDMMWGFPTSLLNGDFYANTTSVSESNPFFIEHSLLHELGHARYLIDCYGFDVSHTPDHATVQIVEAGVPIAGSPYMPFIAWDVVLYYNTSGGIMTGPYGDQWSPYEAGALNRIAFHRAVCGNYNAPCNIGVFLNDLPEHNHMRFLDHLGNPLAGADVKVYRAGPGPGWYGKTFDNTPDLAFTTDAGGFAHMPRNPFSTGSIVHGYGQSNGVMILRVGHGTHVWYRFVEVSDFNLQYWSGATVDAYYTIELPPPVGSEPADLNLDGTVDAADLAILLGGWGPCAACPTTPCATDLNQDCSTDAQDLAVLLGAWTP